MKKLILLALTMVLVFNVNVKSQLKVSSNGNVGIGVIPSSQYSLDFKANSGSGLRFQFPDEEGYEVILEIQSEPTFYPTGYATGYIGYYMHPWWESWIYRSYYYQHPSWVSDGRYKKDINSITDSDVDKLSKIKGVTFKFKEDILNDQVSKNNAKKKKINNLPQYGFIAQEIIDFYPEIATYDTAKDMYFVQYTEFIPILVEGHKKQQSTIETLQTLVYSQEQDIVELKKQVDELQTGDANKKKSKSANIEANIEENDINQIKLYQNSPNPFSDETIIKYFLPEDIIDAQIFIYDLNGTQIKRFDLIYKGDEEVTINGKELNAGMYLYSLIVDGKEIDIKRMILTD